MHYVGLPQSLSHPEQRYTGLTSGLRARLAKHNEGGVPHPAKYRPWAVWSFFAYSTREQAAQSSVT
jgi:predicted GIY-YIG superfamily endonuclease